jgi:short-subunit dehydrogenase
MAVHEQVIKTNLLGYMNGAHAALPIFKQQGAGILINNISIGGFLPVPYGAGYSAAKFGLRGWSEALKGELTEWPGHSRLRPVPGFPGYAWHPACRQSYR